MKNLFLLPTDKSSKLWESKHGRLYCNQANFNDPDGCTNLNIYITSDEIIDNCWVLNTISETVFFVDKKEEIVLPVTKKIILTSDLKLQDSVQAIDDEFLEWFIKNLSCEFVEVIELHNDTCKEQILSEYEIIIPKEEPKQDRTCSNNCSDVCGECQILQPKQETLIRDYSNRSCSTCNLFNTNNGGKESCELNLESKCASFANDESLGDFWISCLEDESDSILYKQETLEEAAKNHQKNVIGIALPKHTFIAGAKWQQQKSYNEEEVINILVEFSAELKSISNITEWFEQFKK